MASVPRVCHEAEHALKRGSRRRYLIRALFAANGNRCRSFDSYGHRHDTSTGRRGSVLVASVPTNCSRYSPYSHPSDCAYADIRVLPHGLAAFLHASAQRLAASLYIISFRPFSSCLTPVSNYFTHSTFTFLVPVSQIVPRFVLSPLRSRFCLAFRRVWITQFAHLADTPSHCPSRLVHRCIRFLRLLTWLLRAIQTASIYITSHIGSDFAPDGDWQLEATDDSCGCN